MVPGVQGVAVSLGAVRRALPAATAKIGGGYWILVLVLLCGAILPVQVAANKRLEQSVHSPVLAATLAFVVGGLALAAVSATGWLGRGQISGATSAPWWVWVAAAFSLFTVVSIIALPDHFGWLGVPKVRLNWWRVAGAILLFAGTLMMQRKG